MISHGLLNDHSGGLDGVVGELGTGDADALSVALGYQGLGLHVDQLILQRRAASIDYQDIIHTVLLTY